MRFHLALKNKKMNVALYKKQMVLMVLLVFISVVNVMAQPVPENKVNRMVTDVAGLFTKNEIQYLESELRAFSDSTSNQIVVVTLADFEGYSKWEVAQNIGKTWGVGHKEDNGVVILIKPKTRQSKGEIAIQVGYGLEGAIPDATAKMIIESDIIPYFKQGNMFKGVENGIMILKALSVGEYNSDQYAANAGSGVESGIPFLFLFFVIVFVFINKAGAARRYGSTNNVPFWTAMMLMNSTGSHGGSYSDFSSGGGGFGGFGGGGFGGGGAGGSW